MDDETVYELVKEALQNAEANQFINHLTDDPKDIAVDVADNCQEVQEYVWVGDDLDQSRMDQVKAAIRRYQLEKHS